MAELPLPGAPVRGSKTGAPLMALFDLMGRSWSMGALWQLSEHGPATFRTLQDRCEGVSPTVLNTRIKELRAAGLVTKGTKGYEATGLGLELFQLLEPMRGWAQKWAREIKS